MVSHAVGPGHESSPLSVRAILLGQRMDTHGLERWEHQKLGVVERGSGWAFVYPFGAVVFAGLDTDDEAALLEELAPRVRDAMPEPEQELARVLVDPDARRTIDRGGNIVLTDASEESFAAVGSVLAKSVLLAHYEHHTHAAMARGERLARRLREGRGIGVREKDLLREIGEALAAQTQMIGRAEVGEKLELTWDLPEVDRTYERLAREYELRERDEALQRKLALIDRTATIGLELIRNQQSNRVEWYIVLLFAIEVVLLLVDMFS